MAEPAPPTVPPADGVCPWCSAAVTPETVTCPSCNAVLQSTEEPNLPGVTAVDVQAARGENRPPQRSRLLSWISGEYPEDVLDPADAQAIAPPDPDVQLEIRRLRLEAEVANLQAEADAILAEAAVEGRVVDLPGGIPPLARDEATTGDESPAATEADADGATPDDEASTDAGPGAAAGDPVADEDPGPPA